METCPRKVCPVSPTICELLELTEKLKETAEFQNKRDILDNLYIRLANSKFDCSSGKSPWRFEKIRQSLQETVRRYFPDPNHPYVKALKSVGPTDSPTRIRSQNQKEF